ncbi:MAG: hypothetical protein WC548_00670 [Candidatus Pacearchaeota archaeon]
MRNYYDLIRSEPGNNKYIVCAYAISDAVKMLNSSLGLFISLTEIPAGTKPFYRMNLDFLRRKEFPSFKDTREELVKSYQNGIAREVIGKLLQSLDEGMLNLEEFVSVTD